MKREEFQKMCLLVNSFYFMKFDGKPIKHTKSSIDDVRRDNGDCRVTFANSYSRFQLYIGW